MTVVTKLALMQLVFTLILTMLIAVFWGWSYAYSALLGGMICALANLFFAGKLFFSKSIVNPEQILQKFYRSEALKLMFIITMFVLVFLMVEIKFLAFILAYSLASSLNLFCLPFLK